MLAIELISGSFGGAAQVISGQPLDTLKTVSRVEVGCCGPTGFLLAVGLRSWFLLDRHLGLPS